MTVAEPQPTHPLILNLLKDGIPGGVAFRPGSKNSLCRPIDRPPGRW